MSTFTDFLALFERTPSFSSNGVILDIEYAKKWGIAIPDEQNPNPAPNDSIATEKGICSLLGIDVLGEIDRGKVKVFTGHHRKISVIENVSRMSYEELLQIAGPPAKAHVMKSKNDDVPGMYSLAQVKESIALLSGYTRIGDRNEIGIGCHPTLNEDGTEGKSVILVGAGEGAEWDGSSDLKQIRHPRHGAHVLDISGDSFDAGWYSFDQLSADLKNCDQDWCRAVITEANALFSRWRWKHQKIAELVTGLVIATFIQKFWRWRPQIGIIGDTNCGKTTFFLCLEAIFSKLAELSGSSSAAGIMQSLHGNSKALFCDEFEESPHRQPILNMLRNSARGANITRGTTTHRRVSFLVKVMAWLSAIEINLREEPDWNRFITLELLPPPASEHGKLTLPSDTELRRLGQKLLAIAVRSAIEARDLAIELKREHHPGVNPRIVESYSVPAAILSLASGDDFAGARTRLRDLLTIVGDDSHRQSTKNALVSDILHATVKVHGSHDMAVSQILRNLTSKHGRRVSEEEALESYGVTLAYEKKGPKGAAEADCANRVLFVVARVVSRKLLANTEWSGKDLSQILERLPGAKRSRRKIAGASPRGIEIPWDFVSGEFFTESSEASGDLFRDNEAA